MQAIRTSELLRRNDVLLAIGCYYFLSNVMQSSVSLNASRLGLQGLVLGVLLALVSGGAGLVTDLGFAAYADSRGRARVIGLGFLGSLISAAMILDSRSVLALWLAAVVFGFSMSATGNALLGMLSLQGSGWPQARLQGVNGSVQRFGALVGAGVIGVCLAVDRLYGVTIGLLVVSCVGIVAIGDHTQRQSWAVSGSPPRPIGELLACGYRTGIGMLGRPSIRIAAMLSMALNVVFIETNSFIPLIHGHGASALVVSGSLGARDIAAIGTGLVVAKSGAHVGSRGVAVAAVGSSALAAVGMGLAVQGRIVGIVVAMSALQGVAVGVGIAATNLFIISTTSEAERALGMAASGFATRSAGIVFPLMAGIALGAGGVEAVFYLVGGVLICLGMGTAVVGRKVERTGG